MKMKTETKWERNERSERKTELAKVKVKDQLSVVVPCFNEEESLNRFFEETTKVLEKMEKKEGITYQILFVDDGSRDKTLDILKELAQKSDRVKYLSFSRNFGKEAAMYAGLKEAEGDYTVVMDADLQHPPALLETMYQNLAERGGKWDCCGGRRKGREGDGAVRSFLSRGFYKACKAVTGLDNKDGEGDFRMMNRAMKDAVLEMSERSRYMKGIFSFVGFQTLWIDYDNVERAAGESKWNLKSLLRYAAEGMLAFSTKPLKLSGILGVFLGGLGIFLAAIGKTGILIPLMLILSGVQMSVLYIMGLYMEKSYIELKHRPVYIIRERN